MNLQRRIVEYLTTELGYEVVRSPSNNYMKLKKDESILWIGKKGAIRAGRILDESVVPPRFFVDRVRQKIA